MNIKLSLNTDSYYYPEKDSKILGRLDIQIPKSAFWSVVGPSGCGKTTILRIFAGLVQLQNGSAKIDGVPYNSNDEVENPKNVALFFQECGRSLLPWLNVQENIVWAIQNKNLDSEKRDKILKDALIDTEIFEHKKDYPHQLSGGYKRRLAIARILAYRPEVLLLDEPCISLDTIGRRKMETLIRNVWEKYSLTVLLVTHEIEEALCLSQRIIVLSKSPCIIKEAIDIPPNLSLGTIEFETLKARILGSLES